MPEFDAADLDDCQISTMLTTSMATIKQYVKFQGLICRSRYKPAVKISTWVYQFCGPGYMDNVIIVTTKWDILADDAVSDNLDRYENWTRDAALEPLVSHGAPTLHHGLVQDASGWRKISLRNQRDKSTKHARAMIFDHYATSSNVVLQFYHEIDQGHSVE
ncbi:uncharacterized protein SETTUDRAFT_64940, partial [Exserohilum turcica Et28A]